MPFARKRFGQHFLEPAWVEKLVRAIAPEPGDTFLEIGPGHGALTRPLVARAHRVLAFEIDRDLAAELRVAALPTLTIVEGDFLDVNADEIRRAQQGVGALRVAGNLPYNVASPILFKLIELYAAGIPFIDATVMLQREVADRLVAPPGTRDYGVLSVLVGYSASVERILTLPPGAFRPAPKVHSAVARLRFHAPQPPMRNPDVFASLVHAIFTRRRKTMANALKAFPLSERTPPALALRLADLDGQRRPETLSIAELAQLAEAFAK